MTLGTRYFTDKSESFKHYMLKILCYRMLREAGRDVYVEFVLGECGIADVYDMDTGYVYEFETNVTRKTRQEKNKYLGYAGVKEVIIFDLKDFPPTTFGMQRLLLSKKIV